MVKNKKKSRFVGKTTSNAKKQQNQSSSYGYLKLPRGVNLFKEEPGRTTLDIIPYVVSIPNHPDLDEQDQIAIEGDLWYKLPFKVHRNIGAGNDTVVCPRTFGKRCPICEYREKRFKEGADKEETDALRASMRNLYLVKIKSSKSENKVQLWDISQYLFQNLLNSELEEDEDYGIFPDLEEGLSLKIRFEEKQLGKNKFAEATRIDFIERKEQYGEDLLDELPSLDEILIIHSYDKLEKMFLELEDDDSDEPKPIQKDEDYEPSIQRKRKVLPSDDEDEDDDLDDEPPIQRKHKVLPPDDEDEDDDLDDEPPIQRKHKVLPPDDEDEDESISVPKNRESGKSQAKDKKDKCPYGHRFGVDTDEFEDCDSCELWDACIEKKEE